MGATFRAAHGPAVERPVTRRRACPQSVRARRSVLARERSELGSIRPMGPATLELGCALRASPAPLSRPKKNIRVVWTLGVLSGECWSRESVMWGSLIALMLCAGALWLLVKNASEWKEMDENDEPSRSNPVPKVPPNHGPRDER